jgi:tripartite motif-containing protein 71
VSVTNLSDSGYHYSHTLGIDLYDGRGFRDPVDVALGPDGTVYVLQRGTPFHQNTLIKKCTIDEEFLEEFGAYGTGPGQWVWPACLIMDAEQRLYVSDEWNNRISIFDSQGYLLDEWGRAGCDAGQLFRPCGIALDHEMNLLVVDAGNHRVQRFTASGEFISGWGGPGSEEGRFNMPWGVAVGPEGEIYVSDWRNDRVQKFTSQGEFLLQWGTSGSDDGQFNRPAGLAVDADGGVYVVDWHNNRVQIFDPAGNFRTKLLGNATVSTWGEEQLANFPEMVEERRVAKDLNLEKLFSNPRGIKVDDQGRVFVVDCARGRIQIYRKEL